MRMIKNNFYVDNMNVTDDDVGKLVHVYKTAIAILQELNFSLIPCNSNSSELETLMKENNSLVQHKSEFERVLGYNYNSSKDLLNIATC